MADKIRFLKSWRLIAAVVAVGAIALGVASKAAPSKTAQRVVTPEERAVAQKRVEIAGVGAIKAVAPVGQTSAPRVGQVPNQPSVPGGGVANTVFLSGFETTDAPPYSVAPLATGPNAGQNGWHCWTLASTPPAPSGAEDVVSSVAAVVSAANPVVPSLQHVRIKNDPAQVDDISVGVISQSLAPSGVATSSLSMDLYIAMTDDGQYNIRPRDTAGSNTVAANVIFAPRDMAVGEMLTTAGVNEIEVAEVESDDDDAPDICILENNLANQLVAKCILNWTPGVYKCFEVSVTPAVTPNPPMIQYRYGDRDIMGICPLVHSDTHLVSADNVDSVHFRHNNVQAGTGRMDVDNLKVNVKLLPGACCTGSTCTLETSNNCIYPNNFIGAGTNCTGSPCAMGRCCAANGACSFGSSGSCVGTFSGGMPADACAINCCDQPVNGADDCANVSSIPVISVPGVANFSGTSNNAGPVDCQMLVADTKYWWQAFTINTCANVTISYCCSNEANGSPRSPVGNFIIQDSGPNGACPCDGATQLFSPDETSVGFGGTLPDVCDDGNFAALWVNLPPGTYYVPLFVEDIGAMPSAVNNGDFQLQISTVMCPIGGCCTGNACTNTNVVACESGGGNYLGDSVACTFACTSGACCHAGQTCTSPTAFGVCVGEANTTYFGGTTCAAVMTANGACPPDNDKCANAATLLNGVTPFDNTGALPDGPADFCQTSATAQDIWYNYTSTCTGNVTVRLCGFVPDFDSVVSVYTDTTCPIDTATRVACNDDFDCDNNGTADGASWSSVTFAATNNQQFKVRVGSFQGGGEFGAGEINVSCAPAGCPCVTAADCKNTLCAADNACNCVACTAGTCVFTCSKFGNTNCMGSITLDDILCALNGFSGFGNCPNADIDPCGGNGIINLDDILKTLAAFGGANPCGCTENSAPGTGVAPLCGSSQP